MVIFFISFQADFKNLGFLRKTRTYHNIFVIKMAFFGDKINSISALNAEKKITRVSIVVYYLLLNSKIF